MLNSVFLLYFSFPGGKDLVLSRNLYSGNQGAAIEDWRGLMERVSYTGGDEGRGHLAGEAVVSVVDGGAAGGDVDVGDAEFES